MKNIFLLMTGAVLFFAACGKDSPDPDMPVDPAIKQLPGTIYYQWADEGVYRYNFNTLNRDILLSDNNSRTGWDVSIDQKLILVCSDVSGDYDASLFTVIKAADGHTVKQFKYYATSGSIATGTLSPDGKLIAIMPTFEDGIVITDLDGEIIQKIQTVNDEKITEPPIWAADNTLLFPFKNLLLKTNKTFTDVSVVKKFEFASWGKPALSRDGKKISLVAGNHIWLMHSDGSELKQITVSSGVETNLAFSPDSRYLLIGTDYHTTGPFGRLFYLKAVPADGKQYTVDDGAESDGVISIIAPGKNDVEPADSKAVWR